MLHTGDMGYISKDNFLYVMGRFKSLLIGNDGEKYSPEGIEEAIVDQSPIIEQAMLYNNQNPYTVGMFVPNMAEISRQLEKQGVTLKSDAGYEKALEMIKNEVDQYKKGGMIFIFSVRLRKSFPNSFFQKIIRRRHCLPLWLPLRTTIRISLISWEARVIAYTLLRSALHFSGGVL